MLLARFASPYSGQVNTKVDNIGRNSATLISRAHSMHNMCLVLAKRFDVASGSHELYKDVRFCWALNYLGLDRSSGVQPRPVLAAAEQVYMIIERAASFSKRAPPSLAQAASSQASAVAEWIPQPSDQLLPESRVTTQIRQMQRAQRYFSVKLETLASQSVGAASAARDKKRAATRWDQQRTQHNAEGPSSRKHLLCVAHAYDEPQRCELCSKVFRVSQKKQALNDACPRSAILQRPGMQQPRP
ncbi:unnamed protein product [Symbiodinium sp. CCMP2592]|nr:unnamed protein product [Symbiodinium sp. CCMP2592]